MFQPIYKQQLTLELITANVSVASYMMNSFYR